MTMTIGEASAKSGIPPKTIRYYEETGLIGKAGRQPNLYRTYSQEDVAMLRFIGRARRLGFSINHLRSLITLWRDRSRSSRDVKTLAMQHLAEVERKLDELRSVYDALVHLIEQCHGDQRADCPIIDDLQGDEPKMVARASPPGLAQSRPKRDRRAAPPLRQPEHCAKVLT